MDHGVRENRKRQGRKKPAVEREAYFRLVQQGCSNKEACPIVGIKWRTGGSLPAEEREEYEQLVVEWAAAIRSTVLEAV